MPAFRVILRPSTGPTAFVRPTTGNLVEAYREVSVEAVSEQEAAEVAFVRSTQMSGAAMCLVAPLAVTPVWDAIVADPTVPEHNRRAELHSRVGLALVEGSLEPAELDPSVGDPRVYAVDTVELVEEES